MAYIVRSLLGTWAVNTGGSSSFRDLNFCHVQSLCVVGGSLKPTFVAIFSTESSPPLYRLYNTYTEIACYLFVACKTRAANIFCTKSYLVSA